MLSQCFFLNMDNIRCVIIKSPKLFIDAKTTAQNPKTCAKFASLGPDAINAPTIITEEIAFVTLISRK